MPQGCQVADPRRALGRDVGPQVVQPHRPRILDRELPEVPGRGGRQPLPQLAAAGSGSNSYVLAVARIDLWNSTTQRVSKNSRGLLRFASTRGGGTCTRCLSGEPVIALVPLRPGPETCTRCLSGVDAADRSVRGPPTGVRASADGPTPGELQGRCPRTDPGGRRTRRRRSSGPGRPARSWAGTSRRRRRSGRRRRAVGRMSCPG